VTHRSPLRDVGKVLLFGALAVALVGGYATFRVWAQGERDERRPADAIVVLGAAQYDGTPSPVFEGRLDHAALLYEQDRAALVFVLGANRPGDRTTEAEAGRDYLIGRGVPADSVVALPLGSSSYTSLRAAARAMRDLDLSSAFLVSDPWHNARIERMASDLGIEGHASATWTSAARTEETRLSGYMRETIAYLYYRVVGG
jgi:uncharacterized SAM-binding protein YcdF (DUF218 family)